MSEREMSGRWSPVVCGAYTVRARTMYTTVQRGEAWPVVWYPHTDVARPLRVDERARRGRDAVERLNVHHLAMCILPTLQCNAGAAQHASYGSARLATTPDSP